MHRLVSRSAILLLPCAYHYAPAPYHHLRTTSTLFWVYYGYSLVSACLHLHLYLDLLRWNLGYTVALCLRSTSATSFVPPGSVPAWTSAIHAIYLPCLPPPPRSRLLRLLPASYRMLPATLYSHALDAPPRVWMRTSLVTACVAAFWVLRLTTAACSCRHLPYLHLLCRSHACFLPHRGLRLYLPGLRSLLPGCYCRVPHLTCPLPVIRACSSAVLCVPYLRLAHALLPTGMVPWPLLPIVHACLSFSHPTVWRTPVSSYALVSLLVCVSGFTVSYRLRSSLPATLLLYLWILPVPVVHSFTTARFRFVYLRWVHRRLGGTTPYLRSSLPLDFLLVLPASCCSFLIPSPFYILFADLPALSIPLLYRHCFLTCHLERSVERRLQPLISHYSYSAFVG